MAEKLKVVYGFRERIPVRTEHFRLIDLVAYTPGQGIVATEMTAIEAGRANFLLTPARLIWIRVSNDKERGDDR